MFLSMNHIFQHVSMARVLCVFHGVPMKESLKIP